MKPRVCVWWFEPCRLAPPSCLPEGRGAHARCVLAPLPVAARALAPACVCSMFVNTVYEICVSACGRRGGGGLLHRLHSDALHQRRSRPPACVCVRLCNIPCSMVGRSEGTQNPASCSQHHNLLEVCGVPCRCNASHNGCLRAVRPASGQQQLWRLTAPAFGMIAPNYCTLWGCLSGCAQHRYLHAAREWWCARYPVSTRMAIHLDGMAWAARAPTGTRAWARVAHAPRPHLVR